MEKPMKTTEIPYQNSISPKSQKAALPYDQSSTSNRSRDRPKHEKKVYLTAMNKMYNDQGLAPSQLVRMQQDKRNLNDKVKDNSKGGPVVRVAGRDSPPRSEDAGDIVILEAGSTKNQKEASLPEADGQ